MKPLMTHGVKFVLFSQLSPVALRSLFDFALRCFGGFCFDIGIQSVGKTTKLDRISRLTFGIPKAGMVTRIL